MARSGSFGDFQLIEWKEGDPSRFDHSRAGWPLQGKHARLACEKCHNDEMRARVGAPDARATSWIGLETGCKSCHDDPHEGRLGVDCAGCHVRPVLAGGS